MTSPLNLDAIDADLEEVRANVAHGAAAYNPWALTALNAAEKLRTEMAQRRLDRRQIEVETVRRLADHVHGMAERGGSPTLTEALHATANFMRRLADDLASGAYVLPGGAA